MIVMSKRYLKSSWCKDELDWFQSQVEARAGGSGRVFVLRAQKTDESRWPEFPARCPRPRDDRLFVPRS